MELNRADTDMPAAVMISKSHKAVTLYIGDEITALTEVNFQR